MEINNIEPLRVADDSSSQGGQTNTLKYIPGSAIRGYVINKLVQQEDFESIKTRLFSDHIRFMNFYLYEGEHELIPSLKGFYEDKTTVPRKKQIENVVRNGEFTDGNKRASLGSYCYLDEDCIYYYHVDTASDLKIKINLRENEKNNVFRNEYITPGNTFVGYIAFDDDSEGLITRISALFGETIILGNARSSGMGKCRVLANNIVDIDKVERLNENKSRS